MIREIICVQAKEGSCCGHGLKSPDLQLGEKLCDASAEGDVKLSNEEKGEAWANDGLLVNE